MKKNIEPGIFLPPEIVDDFTRREFIVGAGLIALAPGCGNGVEDSEETSANTRTIEHKYGSTEIEGMPGRVVTLGFSDHDVVLAFGAKPVGVRNFIGDRVVWPWNEDEFGDSEPDTLPAGDLNFERISALRPDLILGVYSDLTEDEYGTLSEIAPTVAQPVGYPDLAAPWREATRLIGRALGEDAAEIINEVEARLDEARSRHPEFEGSTLSLAAPGAGGEYFIYGPRDSRIQLLGSLGFEVSDEVSEFVEPAPFTAASRERLDLVDADVVVWQVNTEAERESIENDPIYKGLDASDEGRDFFLIGEDPARTALGLITVLSIPYLLEELVPLLAAAIDGDPETEANR